MEMTKKRTGIELQFFELSEKIVTDNDLDLYDLEYIPGSTTLRVYVVDPKTNTAVIEDCVKIDRAFGPYCETLEWIPDEFVLEVSSPGVYRALKTQEHFFKAKDDFIQCTLMGELSPEEKAKLPTKLRGSKKLRGLLVDINEVNILLEIEGVKLNLPLDIVKKANLDPEING